MNSPTITVLASWKTPSWTKGPPSDPRTKHQHTPPACARMTLREALTRRFSTDAMAQDVAPAGYTQDTLVRMSMGPLAVYGGSFVRTVAFADFDTKRHVPWAAGVDLDRIQGQIVGLLTKAGIMPSAVYMTRAGARAVWVLSEPVAIRHWGWFVRWVDEVLAPITGRKTWTDLGLKRGGVDVKECKSPVGIFRLPYVHRDGVDLDPPAPFIADVTLTPEIDPSRDEYRILKAVLPEDCEMPDISEALDERDTLWQAAGLELWSDREYLPTSADWARARGFETWPLDGPPEDLKSASGVRTTIAALAGRAVQRLADSGDYAIAHIPDLVWRLLAPMATRGGPESSQEEYPESGEYLWACTWLFVGSVVDTNVSNPEHPLLVSVAGESGFRILDTSGRYIPVRDSLTAPLLRKLYPTLDPAGSAEAAWSQIGKYARIARFSYIMQGSHFQCTDAADGVLTLGVAPLEDVPPRFDPRCAEYLETLFGESMPAFQLTLASLRFLDHPCVAWFLCGEGGAGKEMLVRAIAAQFRGGEPVPFEKAAQKHNDALLRSPILWVDEEVRSGVSPKAFRELTGNRTHAVEPKGQNTTTVDGYLRVFVTANVVDPLKFSKALQGEAEDAAAHQALAARIRYLDVTDAPRRWLEAHGNFRTTAGWVREADGAPGPLTRHLRWLMDQRRNPIGDSRFIAQAEDDTWLNRLTESGGVETEVMGAILDYLMTAGASEASAFERRRALKPALCVTPSHVFVRVTHLRQAWGAFMGQGARPWRRQTLNACLRNLDDTGKARTHRTPAWGPAHCFRLAVAAIARHAELQSVATAAEIGEAIDVLLSKTQPQKQENPDR